MKSALRILTLGLSAWIIMSASQENTEPELKKLNHSHLDKDMYVIRATVYEVGILTNKTENSTKNINSSGNQESITFYHRNGTDVDLGNIPPPVLTNVTAQSVVAVAPINNNTKYEETWKNWSQLAPLQNSTAVVKSGNSNVLPVQDTHKRSLDHFIRRHFRRDTQKQNGNRTLKIVKGSVTIPPEVGVQSIALPPLLSLNNNLSNIPVPIPNTSVVKYAKVNTLIHAP